MRARAMALWKIGAESDPYAAVEKATMEIAAEQAVDFAGGNLRDDELDAVAREADFDWQDFDNPAAGQENDFGAWAAGGESESRPQADSGGGEAPVPEAREVASAEALDLTDRSLPVEAGADGRAQTVIPGAEKAADGVLAQRA